MSPLKMAKLFNVVPKSGHTAFLQIEIIYFLIKVCFELNLFREKFPTFKIHFFVWLLIFFILSIPFIPSCFSLHKDLSQKTTFIDLWHRDIQAFFYSFSSFHINIAKKCLYNVLWWDPNPFPWITDYSSDHSVNILPSYIAVYAFFLPLWSILCRLKLFRS